MAREALGHFQRHGIDLRAIVLSQGRRFSPEPLELAPADPLEMLM
jgi:hypothetical protein